jgi:hypothetical protein
LAKDSVGAGAAGAAGAAACAKAGSIIRAPSARPPIAAANVRANLFIYFP